MTERKIPKNRRFSIEYRFYDPEKEEREGRKIKFRRNRSKQEAKTKSAIWLFILLAGVVYALYALSKVGI